MKICYLIPDLGITVGGQKGASSHIRGFINALMRQGHQVVIVTSHPAPPGTIDAPVYVMEKPVLIDGIMEEAHPRAFRAMRHLFYNTAVENTLRRVAAYENPDLIYERYSPFSFAGGYISKILGIPHVLEVNAPLAEQGEKYRKQALNEAAAVSELSAFRNTSLIITLTGQLKEWLVGLGIPPGKVHVRPCGVDAGAFYPQGADFRTQFAGRFVLGFVGSLKPWHDLEMLEKVFPELAKDPRFHLLVVGDGPSRKVVQRISDAYPGRVTATGAVSQDEVPAYIRTMDIALAPYPDMELFYFSPLKVYEYMAMGKPVIATRIGQLEELIENGVNGMLVPPGEPMAWVDAIRGLAGQPEKRQLMGERARENAASGHTWEKRVETFITIVNECVLTGELAAL
jgi:glycosyltransferase involved in cell wall biosynthesis